MKRGLVKYHRDYKPLVKAALKVGWTLSSTGGSHPRLLPPKGWTRPDGTLANPITIPSSPSDRRSLLNTRRDMRHQGIDC